MKRLLLLLLCLCLPMAALGQGLPALYTARATTEIRLRQQADATSAPVGKVPEDEKVCVHQVAEDWSLCTYDGACGWIPMDKLYEFTALTAGTPLPKQPICTGLAEITATVTLSVEGYSGNTLQPGTRMAVLNENGALPMMRSTAQLPEGSFTFQPFVHPDEATTGNVLYAFTTYYNQDTGGKLAPARIYNIELAAAAISGFTLQPGEVFSYNRLCGPYTTARGYQIAPNISQSGIGPGGGVCQLTTTLFNAVLGLPLTIKEWQVHRISGVPYAPMNFDCAVGTARDFRFVNDLMTPLRIEVHCQEGALTVLLLCDGEPVE